MKRYVFLLFLFVLPCRAQAQDPIASSPLVERYCIDCHGPHAQEGNVRLDLPDNSDAAFWKLVYEQLATGTMPPGDEVQPISSERREMSRAALNKAIASTTPERAVMLRRLNKREYGNTIRILLGLDDARVDPAEFIPNDMPAEGFDTQAGSLVLSDDLLLEYMNAAEASLKHAIFSLSPTAPAPQLRVVELRQMHAKPAQYFSAKADQAVIRGGGTMQLSESERTRSLAQAGRYKVTVTVRGIDRHAHSFACLPEGPFQMGFGVRVDGVSSTSNTGQLLEVVNVKDDVDETFEFETWIDAGAYPYVSFPNAHPKPITQLRAAMRQGKAKPEQEDGTYHGPGLLVSDFAIEGPFHQQWPTTSHRVTLGSPAPPDLTDPSVRQQVVLQFVTRAFRREVTDAEIAPYLELFHQRVTSGNNELEALTQTFAAVLSSPDFIYLSEPDGRLDAYALANRLSYFFWSMCPDTELSLLAQHDQLLKPEVRAAQVTRLLDDPRSISFANSFTDQWLRLHLLGTMPPDERDPQFRIYFQERLQDAMAEETRLFFWHVLRENRSVGDFIDSDYTFINSGLAKLYDLPLPAEDAGFVKVSLPNDSKRGGVLGQASILTLTANGVETSPVERGVWLLRHFLGSPLKPAPAEVPALVPDLNGAKTVRELLAAHRNDASCRDCHQRIDPPGFALEAYDPIGRLRSHYPEKLPIDDSGTFDGTDFEDLSGFQQILLRDARPFARSLTIRIAEYAKGRPLNVHDMSIVEDILDTASPQGYRLRDLVVGIAKSDLIQLR